VKNKRKQNRYIPFHTYCKLIQFTLNLLKKIKDQQKNKPVDLVKQFYDQDIDHKALEKALTQRKNTAKGFTNFSLEPYTGEFGDAQKKHLLN